MFHNDMPIDDSIQRVIGDRIQERLAAFRPASPPLTTFRLETGTALEQTGDNWDFGVLPNGDLVGIKKSGTGTGKTEVHILAGQ